MEQTACMDKNVLILLISRLQLVYQFSDTDQFSDTEYVKRSFCFSFWMCHLTALINTIIPHVLQKTGGTLCWEERDTVTIT